MTEAGTSGSGASSHSAGDASLLARARRLDAIIEGATDAIVALDSAHRITTFNRAAERMFGWKAAEMIGKPLDVLLPQAAIAGHARWVDNFGAQPDSAARPMGRSRRVEARRADGELFPIEASISKVTIGDERFYTAIIRDLTEREREAAELAAAREEIRRLSAIAQIARDGADRRLAQQLHEDLAQDLAAVKMELALLTPCDGNARDAQAELIGSIADQVDHAIETTRSIANDLQPALLDDLGLQAALDSLVARFRKRYGVPCEVAIAIDPERIARPVRTVIYRVVQRTLENVGMHAMATAAGVEIGEIGEQILVRVQDDGKGFDVRKGPPRAAFGLIDLADRLNTLGGTLKIDSAPGRGTTVTARVPKVVPFGVEG